MNFFKTISLYLHSPFCVNKCGYCDFNSWEENRVEPQKLWAKGVQRQSQFWSQKLRGPSSGAKSRIQTLFWGGGTPSLIENSLTQEVLNNLKNDWDLSHIQEFTIEVNPETLTQEKLDRWAELGINRLSMGIQSFEDRYLEKLERRARRKDNLKALDLVAKNWKGKRGWSLDLMFGLPEQSLTEMQNDLHLALEFNPTHLSSYQLTLTTKRSESWKQPEEEILIEMMDLRQKILEKKGYFKYEVSNFSKPGFESLHNLNYWQLNSFIGIGPGARGLLGADVHIPGKTSDFGFHQSSPDNFDKWMGIAGDSNEFETLTPRTRSDHILERLMMGLRLEAGIDLKVFTKEIQTQSLPEVTLNINSQKWARETVDLDKLKKGFLCLTPQGQKILDTLVPKFAKLIE